MGFTLHDAYAASAKTNLSSKNRVRNFFGKTYLPALDNRTPALCLRRENNSRLTKLASGRTLWLSRDPIGELGDGPNLYAYVLNNPVRFIDPDGRMIFDKDGYDRDARSAREKYEQSRRDFGMETVKRVHDPRSYRPFRFPKKEKSGSSGRSMCELFKHFLYDSFKEEHDRKQERSSDLDEAVRKNTRDVQPIDPGLA